MGTGLVAAGAGVLNQVAEREADARMVRTARRAIPSGRVSPEHALLFGLILGLGGLVHVTLFLNLTTAALAAVTLASYVLVYTPLKRKTPLNTLVGAIPGALPPVGGLPPSGIAWRDALSLVYLQISYLPSPASARDYRGGFRMLTVCESADSVTAPHRDQRSRPDPGESGSQHPRLSGRVFRRSLPSPEPTPAFRCGRPESPNARARWLFLTS
jgi:protoheme IX farnesyltransferase